MFFNLISILVAAAICFIASINCLHMLQLESYQTPGYLRWLRERGIRKYPILLVSAVLYAAALIFHMMESDIFAFILLLVSFAAGAWYIVSAKIRDAKKPLVYTARIKRFLTGEILVLALFVLFALVKGSAAFALLLMIQPLLVVLVHFIMLPIEKSINNWYMNDAKKILKSRPELIKIGITGSYGKTSVKYIVGTILKEKYKVLVPPSSYNTPMGVTRVIREQLLPEHEVFIAEMGARHVGDIKELVDFVHPKYGIITSVGPQHLETFHSIENVANTKYELIAGLPEDGAAFFPEDHGLAKGLYEREIPQPKTLFGVEEENCDLSAWDIKAGSFGSEFTVRLKNGESFTARTKLLGRHNIMNIMAGAALAEYLGLSAEEIRSGIEKIEPVEHRLQLIPTGNGVNVIDDAFNSNPAGAAAALEVLASFEGRKIIVTPGMVELGAKQDEENAAFARKIAKVADFVFLVGIRQTKPMFEALEAEGFDMTKVRVSPNLTAASNEMYKILMAGDTVLFENDLPDNYSE